jgi:hypothetical protein
MKYKEQARLRREEIRQENYRLLNPKRRIPIFLFINLILFIFLISGLSYSLRPIHISQFNLQIEEPPLQLTQYEGDCNITYQAQIPHIFNLSRIQNIVHINIIQETSQIGRGFPLNTIIQYQSTQRGSGIIYFQNNQTPLLFLEKIKNNGSTTIEFFTSFNTYTSYTQPQNLSLQFVDDQNTEKPVISGLKFESPPTSNIIEIVLQNFFYLEKQPFQTCSER